MGRNGTQTVEEIKVRLIHSTREGYRSAIVLLRILPEACV